MTSHGKRFPFLNGLTNYRNDPNLLKDPEQSEIPKVHSNPNGDKKKFSGYKKHSITGNRFGTLNLNSKAAVGSKLDKKRKKHGKDRKRNATLTNGIESEEAAAVGAVVGSLSTSTGSFRFNSISLPTSQASR